MPRAHLSKRLSDADAIDLFAKHHVTQVRRRKNGEIVAVKHIAFGWITPEKFYGLQKMHDFLPVITKVIEGGYRTKSLLWGISAEVTILGTTASIPLGMAFPLIETLALQDAIAAGNTQNILYWGLALLAPFGDVLAITAVFNSITSAISPGGVFGGPPGTSPEENIVELFLVGPLGKAMLDWFRTTDIRKLLPF